MPTRSFAIIACAALAACAGDPATAPAVLAGADAGAGAGADEASYSVVTGSSSYALSSDQWGLNGRVDFRFTNTTERPISMVNCRGAYTLSLEKREGEEWVHAYSPVQLACLSPPIVVEVGETRDGALGIFAGAPGTNLHPQFSVEEVDGTYRLVIGSAYWGYDHDGPPWGVPVPEEYRVSNPFEIRVE